MKGNFFASNSLTLLLIASIAGVYLLISFNSQQPWLQMLQILKEGIALSILVIAFLLHIFFKAIYMLLRFKRKRFASAILLLSFFLLSLGIFVSNLVRETERYKMSVGDKTEKGEKLLNISMEIPHNMVVLDEGHGFKIDMVKAIIEDNGREITLKSFPFVRMTSGYAYINTVGLSPDINVRVDGTEVSLSKLDLLAHYKEGESILIGDYQLNLSFAMDKYGDDKDIRFFNLKEPAYKISLKRSGNIIIEGIVHDNESLNEDNVWINIGRTDKWIEVIFVRNHPIYLFYIGFISLLFGVFLYPVEIYYRIHG
ncbi:MAG: hypothetical protein Fur0020_10860 [Thermodesulfovibrionia bacterium]